MKSLGRALHYIQDKSVSKGFLGLSHDSREGNVSSQTISEDAIENAINNAISSPHYVEKTIKSVKPKKNLNELMDQACSCSAAITRAVIGEKTPPDELVENYRCFKERYRRRPILLSIVTFGIILVASIILQNFLYAILGIICGICVGISYKDWIFEKYRYLKEEAKWFGIE